MPRIPEESSGPPLSRHHLRSYICTNFKDHSKYSKQDKIEFIMHILSELFVAEWSTIDAVGLVCKKEREVLQFSLPFFVLAQHQSLYYYHPF